MKPLNPPLDYTVDRIGNNWWVAIPERGSPLFFRTVTLTLRVPVCGSRDGELECRLPPGHESGDVPCIVTGWPDQPGTFRTITRVTNQDPRLVEA
jgi:hypothetical protein